MTHHYDTFRDQLAIAHPAFGHALWEPDPGGLYPRVAIGDVGYIREGKFHRLFNALLPGNDPSNKGAPGHHGPLHLNMPNHLDRGILHPNQFCSYGVRSSSGGTEYDPM